MTRFRQLSAQSMRHWGHRLRHLGLARCEVGGTYRQRTYRSPRGIVAPLVRTLSPSVVVLLVDASYVCLFLQHAPDPLGHGKAYVPHDILL